MYDAEKLTVCFDLNVNPSSHLCNLYVYVYVYTHGEGGIFTVPCQGTFCLFYVYVGVWKTLELIWFNISVIHDFNLLVYVKMTWRIIYR
jgi:hypothetical protein